MSHSGVSERIGFLRRRLAAIEARAGAAAMGGPFAAAPETLAAGASIDALFSAGCGHLSEILPARAPDAPAAAAFAFALALRARAARGGRALVLILEDVAAREFGLPYGRGLAQAGLDLSAFALVRTRRPRETLRAMEEALESPACAAVVAETFATPRLYDLTASRRLLLAARRGGALGIFAPLAPPQGAGGARFSSAAALRVEIAAAPPGTSGAARPPPSPAAPFLWRLRLLKARAGLWGETDPAQWRDIAFDPERAAFRHAFPERLSAQSPDRPAAAPARRRA